MMTTHKPKLLPAFFLITAACFLMYSKAIGYGFIWDDFGLIVKTDAFRKWSNLGKFFTVPYWILGTGKLVPYHRPMAPLLILLASTFSGIQPWGYHFLGIFLFAVTSFFLYLFIKHQAFDAPIAEIATAIFIVHPVNAETVIWVCCQPTLFSGICFAVLLILSSKLNTQNSKKVLPAIALVFGAGSLAYHSVLCLPFLAFFRDLMDPNAKAEKPWSLRFKEYGLYVLLTGLFTLYNMAAIYHAVGTIRIRPFYFDANANLVYGKSFLDLLLAPLNTVFRYSESLLFPFNLSPDVYFKAADIPSSSLISFLLIAFTTLLVSRSKTYSRPIVFSALWMLCGLATVANVLPQGGLFADRYLFVSVMGFGFWAAVVFQAAVEYVKKKMPNLRLAVFVLGLGILGIYGFKTWQQCNIWQSDFSFWFYASKLTPSKARNHYNLGTWWQQTGHYPEAAEEYKKALQLDPEDFEAASKRLAEVTAKLTHK